MYGWDERTYDLGTDFAQPFPSANTILLLSLRVAENACGDGGRGLWWLGGCGALLRVLSDVMFEAVEMLRRCVEDDDGE